MKDLLSEEHDYYKGNIFIMKSRAYPPFCILILVKEGCSKYANTTFKLLRDKSASKLM